MEHQPHDDETHHGNEKHSAETREPETERDVDATAAAIARIETGLEQHGLSFLAFLIRPGTDHGSPDLLEQYSDCYIGSFDSRQSFMDEQLFALGWTDALEDLRREEGIGDNDLTWNYDAIWQKCTDAFVFVDTIGGLYVFSS